ncbi:SDH family Clp fold serine proteinase [Flavobacterium sp. ABG]|uniref:SDH family Clp fold serine proteinase n=1 Tax=Flavobacterium sp. ABG TaxID=1423322 RepID=UPI00069AF3AB|nr:hypothetical protein [Flavobacterium sp. ABG]
MNEINEALGKLIEKNDADYYLLSATIDDSTADQFVNMLRDNIDKRKNCVLILTTYGGDPDAGYRIVRAIHRSYDNVIFNVFGSCKSTGTLMALGADEIVMSDFSEFGPLDIQLMRDDELSNTSGLNIVQSLMSLNEQLFRSFEENFLGLKRKSKNSITTRTAAEICSKLSVGLISPISAQIDPVKLGEIQRAIKIAEKYGTRLLRGHNRDIISKLIVGYPSHGFVIDYDEAKDLFCNVRWLDDDEKIIETLLFHVIRNEANPDVILQLFVELEDQITDKNEPTLENENDNKEESINDKINSQNNNVTKKDGPVRKSRKNNLTFNKETTLKK